MLHTWISHGTHGTHKNKVVHTHELVTSYKGGVSHETMRLESLPRVWWHIRFFWWHIGLLWLHIGLFWLLFWRHTGPFWWRTGLFWQNIGLFWRHMGLFWQHIGFFCRHLGLFLSLRELRQYPVSPPKQKIQQKNECWHACRLGHLLVWEKTKMINKPWHIWMSNKTRGRVMNASCHTQIGRVTHACRLGEMLVWENKKMKPLCNALILTWVGMHAYALMAHSRVLRLIHVCCDSSMCVVTHLCVPLSMSRHACIFEWCVSHEWVTSQMNESWNTWRSHVTYRTIVSQSHMS